MFAVTGLKVWRTIIDIHTVHMDLAVDQNLDIQILVRIVVIYIVGRIGVVEYGTRLRFDYGLVCSAIVSRPSQEPVSERLTVE